MRIYKISFLVLLTSAALAAEPQGGNAHGSRGTSTTNYLQTAAQINDILAQVPAPRAIKAALHEAIDTDWLSRTNQPNWPTTRLAISQTIFTNLSQLEAALSRTRAVTNFIVKPPDLKASGGILSPMPDELVTDPADREQLQAYRSALGAHGKLWNLHQQLLAVHNQYAGRATKLVADAYSRPPSGESEIRQLISAYPTNNFALEVSNRLFAHRK